MEQKFMKRCFDLATKGLKNVAPNPMVGAVIVFEGKIIGEGFHRKFGEPHAEVNAIVSVKNPRLLKKSTLYVNLEPCSHHGKTPPCADLIIKKGIPEVVISNNDPFPQVSGRGIKMMREAGIKVTEGFLEKEGRLLNRRFFTFHTKKRPYIILKWAQTTNGFMDEKRNSSDILPLRISSLETSLLSHKLRSEESAILVGTRTAKLDNPELTVRKWHGNNPVRVLIDRDLEVPSAFNIFNPKSHTLVFTETLPEKTIGENIEYIIVPFSENKRLPLSVLLKELYNRNLQSLIVEGGSRLLQSFLDENYWDEARVETALNLSVKEGVRAPSVYGHCTQTEIIGQNLIQHFLRNDEFFL